jgi:hypothetical protein
MIIGYLILQKLNDNNKITFSDVAISVLSVCSAVLEASNTKNDILVTYFILNYIYCWVLLIKEGKVNVFLFVSSIALSILTKGTSYVFLTAITIGFLFLLVIKIKLFKRLVHKENVFKMFLSVLIVLFLLTPFFYRNISLSGNIYCQDQKEKIFYQNEEISVKSVASNSIKNLSIQFCPPFNVIPVYTIVQKAHRFLNLPSVDDPALNFGRFKYATPEMKIKNYFEEDSVPNFFLFFISCIVFISAFFYFKKQDFYYWLGGFFIFLIIFVLFSALLKWQIWHTRLLIPAFIILSLSNLFIIKNSGYCRIWFYMAMLAAFVVIIFNNQRPLLPFGKITRTFNNNLSNISYYDALPKNKNVIYKYQEFNKRFQRGGLNIGFICKNDAGLFPYMWNNRLWKNNYFFVGKIDNLSGNLQQEVPVLDYIVFDGKLINDNSNRLIIKDYQLIDISSFGMMLYKKTML